MINSIEKVVFLAVALLALSIYIPWQRKKNLVNRWQKTLHLKEHAEVFFKLYENTNGFALSLSARQKQDALDFVYGEIEFLPFIALLSLTNPNANTIFYDLGCGVGKAVLACAMVYPVQKCVGIELLPELYSAACEHVVNLAKIKNDPEPIKRIQFILGDFLKVNLEEATCIFINSSSLFNPTWEKISARLDQLPHLVTVITTSKALPCKNFTVSRRTQVEMSWGTVLAYVHIRRKRS